MYLEALAAHVGDDGTAMLTALTKCDAWSWCDARVMCGNADMRVAACVHHNGFSYHSGGAFEKLGIHRKDWRRRLARRPAQREHWLARDELAAVALPAEARRADPLVAARHAGGAALALLAAVYLLLVLAGRRRRQP